MAHAPRKIVFNIPSLLPDRPAHRADPVPRPASPAPPEGDVRKLATIMEVGEALAGTLNLQSGLYGVLEVLERRCGALRGTVALLEEETGLLAVEAALGHPPAVGRVRHRVGEGIPGRAVQSAAPVLVPQDDRETGETVTVLGVPIL